MYDYYSAYDQDYSEFDVEDPAAYQSQQLGMGFWWGGFRPWWGGFRPWWGGFRPWWGFRPWGGGWGGPWGWGWRRGRWWF